MREPIPESVFELANLAADGLAPFMDKEFAFFGHSLGAVVAYELAQILRRRGSPQPRHLIASAHRGPQIEYPGRPTWDLPDLEFTNRLVELNGTPMEVLQHDELLQLMLPLLRADFRLDETYSHPPDYAPLDCAITAIGGNRDYETSVEDLIAWKDVTTGPFKLLMIEGDHFFIHSQALELVRHVNRILLGEAVF